MASFSKGTSFTDGVTGDVTAAKLHALVDAATPVAGLVTDRTAETSVASGDQVLIADASDSNALKKMTVTNLFKTDVSITSGTGTAGTVAIGPTGDTNTGMFFPAADTIAFSEGGTESMRIDSSGNVGVGLTPTSRNNTRLQIVDGIGFPATAVASSDVNTLDDYEEGTFTPTVIGTTTAGTANYSGTTGSYIKIGNVVTFHLKIAWSSGNGTGNLRVAGLPFTSNSLPTSVTIGLWIGVDLTTNYTPYASTIQSSTQIYLMQATTVGDYGSDVAYDAAGELYLGGSYYV